MQKRAIIGVVTVAVLVALGWGGWWWTHPTLLSDESLELGSGSAGPRPVAEAVHHVGVAGRPGKTGGRRETVTFHGYRPHFKVDGAGVKVALSVCVPRMESTGPVVLGVVDDDLNNYCTEVRPVKDGTRMQVGSREYLVATLTATRVGRSTLTAISVNYSRSRSHLWQHGDDRIEGSMSIRATG